MRSEELPGLAVGTGRTGRSADLAAGERRRVVPAAGEQVLSGRSVER